MSAEPVAKRAASDEGASEGRDCPICLESWGKNGEHRVCSLKCGHLFGLSCVELWLNTKKTCPSCTLSARRQDIRILFVSQVSVTDTSEVDKWRRQFQVEKQRRVQSESDKAKLRLQVEALNQEVQVLKASFAARAKCPPSLSRPENVVCAGAFPAVDCGKPCPASSGPIPNWTLHAEIDTMGARAMAFLDSALFVTTASHKKINDHGILKISLADPRHTEHLATGEHPIRDMKASSSAKHLLSICNSGTLHLTDSNTNRVLVKYSLPTAGWSCEFSPSSEHILYAGSIRGSVSVFDLRKTNAAVESLYLPGCPTPVHSISSFEGSSLVFGTSGGVWKFSEHHRMFHRIHDPLPASCLSVYTPSSSSRYCLASLRAGKDESAHNILDSDGSVLAVLKGFSNQTVMSRACIWGLREVPDFSDLMVTAKAASGDDRTCQPVIWSCSTGEVLDRLLPHPSPLLATQHGSCSSGREYLACLSACHLKIYRYSSEVL